MSAKVSQEKVDDLKADIRENIPDAEIIYKDEPLPKWWMHVLFLIIKVIGLFASEFEKTWFNSISNGIGGKWIFLPSRETHGDHRDLHVYKILRHEYVHLRDQNNYPFWFGLTYIFLPLPTLFTGRAHWEIRGYVQNMIVEYEERGYISDRYLEWIGEQFWGGLYLWMYPFKKVVRDKLRVVRDAIEDGQIKGLYPDVKWYGKPTLYVE